MRLTIIGKDLCILTESSKTIRVQNFPLQENPNDDEVYMLYCVSKSHEGLITRKTLGITTLSERQCLGELHQLLKLPTTLVAANGSRMHSFDGMCVYCGGWSIVSECQTLTLQHPFRSHDLFEFLGRGISILSRHYNLLLSHIYSESSHLLTSLDQAWLKRCKLRRMSDAVSAKSPPLLIAEALRVAPVMRCACNKLRKIFLSLNNYLPISLPIIQLRGPAGLLQLLHKKARPKVLKYTRRHDLKYCFIMDFS